MKQREDKNREFSELEPYEKEELLKQIKVNWTYNSNAIEGNTLSLGDTSFIIENGLTVSGKSIAEHNQVLGHIKALDIVYQLLEKEKITEEDLFLLHKAIQTQIVVDYEKPNGAYKVMPNGRWVNIDGKQEHFYYPQPKDTPYLMQLWFDDYATIDRPINSKKEAIEIYTDAHLSFTSIHPFWDGNGRLARLLSNLPLLKNEYLPIIISNKHKQKYLELLAAYNLSTKPLDSNTKVLVDRDADAYIELLKFFESEYKNSEELLRTMRNSKLRNI